MAQKKKKQDFSQRMLFFTKIVKEAKKKLRCDGVQNIHNGYGGKTATDGTLRRAEEGR